MDSTSRSQTSGAAQNVLLLLTRLLFPLVISPITQFFSRQLGLLSEGISEPKVPCPSLYEDAIRRDLTINSLFYNLKTGMVEDWTHQVYDAWLCINPEVAMLNGFFFAKEKVKLY